MDVAALIPAEVRAQLKALRLVARHAGGAQGLGQHSSRHRGVGLEFAQYRAYEPGDEPRRVDWKLYARSDRYFVRESERDSPLDVWLLIDASASMQQTDSSNPGYSRLHAARTLAACVMELAVRQGDRFGLACLQSQELSVLPALAGARQRDRVLHALLRCQAAGQLPDDTRLRPLWEHIAPHALVLMLSDALDERVPSLAERLAAARREVIVLQILTAEERDFPFRAGHRFVDPETGEERLVDATAARAHYLQAFAQAQQTLQRRLSASGIRYACHYLDNRVDAVLRQLFAASARGGIDP